MDLFTLSAKLSVDMEQFSKSLNDAQKSFEKAAKDIEKAAEKVGKTADENFDEAGESVKEAGEEAEKSVSKWKNLGGVLENIGMKIFSLKQIASVVTGVLRSVTKVGASLAQTGFQYNMQMENYTTNFTVMLGSAEAAAKRIEELKEKARKSPYTMADYAEGTQTLLSYNVAAEDTTEILSMLGDIALGDKEKFQSLALNIGQISSMGKLQAQDMKQLAMAGFNPLNEIIKRTGESYEEADKRMSAGLITFAELKQALKDATSEGGKYYKGQEEGAKTVSGQWSTLQGNWEEFLGKIMEPVNLEVGESIIPALLRGLQKVSDALFGVKEDAADTKKVLFTDTTGAEINPSSNLSTWFNDLMQTWTDGKPEDDKIVSDFVQGFKSNTAAIVDVLQARVDDVTGAYTDEEKDEMQKQIDRLHELDSSVEALLQKRKNGYLTAEDQKLLQSYLAEIAAIQAQIEVVTAADVDLSSWAEIVTKAFRGAGEADADAVNSFVRTLKSETKLVTDAMQGMIDDISGAVSEEDKEQAEKDLAFYSSLQDELIALMEKRKTGDWTEADEQRFNAIVATMDALAGLYSHSSAADANFKSWLSDFNAMLASAGAADEQTVSAFARSFDRDTNLIKDEIQKRLDSGTLSEADQKKYEDAMQQIEALQEEWDSIMSLGAENWTDEDKTRLSEIATTLSELFSSLGLGNASSALSPWERFISKISGMAVDGIDALADLIADFLSDPENLEKIITDFTDGLEKIPGTLEDIAEALKIMAAPFRAIWNLIQLVKNALGAEDTYLDFGEADYPIFGDQGAWNQKVREFQEEKYANSAYSGYKRIDALDSQDLYFMQQFRNGNYTGISDEFYERLFDGMIDEMLEGMPEANIGEWIENYWSNHETPVKAQQNEWGEWYFPDAEDEISSMSTSVEDLATETKRGFDAFKEDHATSDDIAQLGEDILNRPNEIYVYLNGTEFSNAIAKETRTAQTKLSRRLTLGKGAIPGVTNGRR